MNVKYLSLNNTVKAHSPERPPTAKGMKLMCLFINLIQLSSLHAIFFSAYEGLRFPTYAFQIDTIRLFQCANTKHRETFVFLHAGKIPVVPCRLLLLLFLALSLLATVLQSNDIKNTKAGSPLQTRNCNSSIKTFLQHLLLKHLEEVSSNG